METDTKRQAGGYRMLSVHIPIELGERIDHYRSTGPYPPSIKEIVIRGLQLALNELDAAKGAPR